jgi:predicted FMN-binding regulatory protein PaiB
MRENPLFEVTDPAVVAGLIRANPWATLVSATTKGLVASHYPVLLDEEADGLTVLTHVGRPDDQLHQLGAEEMMFVFQGNHGYVSPGWYVPEEMRVSTWNFTVAHCYGAPSCSARRRTCGSSAASSSISSASCRSRSCSTPSTGRRSPAAPSASASRSTASSASAS